MPPAGRSCSKEKSLPPSAPSPPRSLARSLSLFLPPPRAAMSPPAAAGLPAPLRCAPPPIREEETAQQRWARPREIPSMTDRSRSQSERAVRVIMRTGGTAGCNGGRWGVRVVRAACAARHRSWGLGGVLGPGLPPSERVLCERRGRPEALGPSGGLQ